MSNARHINLFGKVLDITSGSSSTGLTTEQINAFDEFFSTLTTDSESLKKKDKLIKLLKGETTSESN